MPLEPFRSTDRVLALFPARERRLLFPFLDDQDDTGWEWIDPSTLTEETWPQLLASRRPRVLVTGWTSPTLPLGHSRAEGGSVKYVCHATGSVRHVASRKQIELGLLVTNWGNLIGPIVAEHALLLTLAALRNLPRWPKQNQGRDVWSLGAFDTRTLRKKNVGLYGFGGIARALIDLLRPFEAPLMAFSPGVPADFIQRHGVRPADSLAQLFAANEIVICCESLTEQTAGSIDANLLSRLPIGGTFVNVGRGKIVCESQLPAVVRDRQLRIALDVFATEPLPAESPLWGEPGVIVSPHVGGPTDDACPECGRWARENVARFLSGDQPKGLISVEIFDRST